MIEGRQYCWKITDIRAAVGGFGKQAIDISRVNFDIYFQGGRLSVREVLSYCVAIQQADRRSIIIGYWENNQFEIVDGLYLACKASMAFEECLWAKVITLHDLLSIEHAEVS